MPVTETFLVMLRPYCLASGRESEYTSSERATSDVEITRQAVYVKQKRRVRVTAVAVEKQ
jgi:hypothetical protein